MKKKLVLESILVSMLALGLSPAAIADEVQGDVSATAGYSLGSGATLGASGSVKLDPMKSELERDYNSVTVAKLEPRIEGDIQVDAADGAVQKVGVAVKGFSITTAVDHRANGGDGIGIMQLLSPTLQYKKDNRLGVAELPRLDYFRVGMTGAPDGQGNMCGILAPAWILAPNAVQALTVDSKVRGGFSWNVDAFCHAELGKKTGQLDLQVGAEATVILGGGTMAKTKIYADGRIKNINGSPIYAGAQVSTTHLDMDSGSRSVTDTGAFVGIAY